MYPGYHQWRKSKKHRLWLSKQYSILLETSRGLKKLVSYLWKILYQSLQFFGLPVELNHTYSNRNKNFLCTRIKGKKIKSKHLHRALRDGARGGLGGYSPPVGGIQPPVGGNFGFSSEEIWQNNARKHHFSVILAPLSEAPAPLSENFWRHPCEHFVSLIQKLKHCMPLLIRDEKSVVFHLDLP